MPFLAAGLTLRARLFFFLPAVPGEHLSRRDNECRKGAAEALTGAAGWHQGPIERGGRDGCDR